MLVETIRSWPTSLHQNEVALVAAFMGGLLTILAAFVGVHAAFSQIRTQFEHKVVYEAWKDFQSKLFSFSSALNDYWAQISHLSYMLKSQDNSLVNRGNKHQYRFEQWNEFMRITLEMRKAYIDFLISFETHEVIFLNLSKMHSLFAAEMKNLAENKNYELAEAIFPESYGKSNSKNIAELEQMIASHTQSVINIIMFLQDMRIELQNETIGTILGKEVPKRQPDKGLKILTRRGWRIQKKQPKKNK